MMAMVMALGLVFAAGSAWAEDPNDAITFTMDLAPVITIGSGSTANTTKAISANDGSAVANTAWLVTSNNGFTVSFDGDALSDDGTTALGEPWFTKQDVNASGTPQTGYDHLTTTFAVDITGEDSVAGTNNIWGTSVTVPVGIPEKLEYSTDNTGASGSSGYFSTIMTDDDAGTATVNLYAKGLAAVDCQSGNYTTTVTCTVTGVEIE